MGAFGFTGMLVYEDGNLFKIQVRVDTRARCEALGLAARLFAELSTRNLYALGSR